MRKVLAVLACVALGLVVFAPAARADVWDSATDTDDVIYTDNELIHGSNQLHDLGVRYSSTSDCTYVSTPCTDVDWYLINSPAYSSWEVVIDGTTGDIGYSFNFARWTNGGGSNLQTYTSVTPGWDYAKFLAWENTTSTDTRYMVKVWNPSCGTSCSTSDQYRIRSMETTIGIPRFNNSGGQVTVLICQNVSTRSISGRAHLWNETASATPITSITFTLTSRDVTTWNLSTYANTYRGAITVTHNGRYGEVVCKSVALEPATGFSFDSPGVTKPY